MRGIFFIYAGPENCTVFCGKRIFTANKNNELTIEACGILYVSPIGAYEGPVAYRYLSSISMTLGTS